MSDQAPIQPTLSPTPVPPKSHKWIWLLVIIAVAILAFAIGAFSEREPKVPCWWTIVGCEPSVPNVPAPTPTQAPEETPLPADESGADDVPDLSVFPSLSVSWSAPFATLFHANLQKQLTAEFEAAMVRAGYKGEDPWIQKEFADAFEAFDVGQVKGGEYDGYRVVVHQYARIPLELGDGGNIVFVLLEKSDQPSVLLSAQSDEGSSFGYWGDMLKTAEGTVTSTIFGTIKSTPTLRFLDGIVLKGANPSRTLVTNRGVLRFVKRDRFLTDGEFATLATTPPIASTQSGTAVYRGLMDGERDREDLFFTVGGDRRLNAYYYVIPFLRDGVPQVLWNDGTTNAQTYIEKGIGGCGTTAYANVVDPGSTGELISAGTVSPTGVPEAIFVPKDLSVAPYVSVLKYSLASDFGQKGVDPVAAAAFRPFFFWADPFGRLIQFTHPNFIPATECGKPVIYLYPEKTTDLTVEVAPAGGFSYTDPVYNNGWRVTASPDGTLINKDDGKTYPYLFWEGRGGMYASPEKYWVVAKDDVHGFLVDTLAKLGLNEKETADFMEFWFPRMQAAPYYKIGFHGTNVMNQLAPLSISQSPETLVRILMDYQELSEAIPANPPRLSSSPPARRGFTVIEWGGVLR